MFLNAGIRYDDYGINSNGFATVNGVPNVFGQQAANFGLPNYNVGAVYKPLPYASVYAAYATSSNPIGAELDGVAAQYGGLAPVLNGNPNQIFGPEQNQAAEIGTKWELFDKRLLVTGALFQTKKENARESRNITRDPASAGQRVGDHRRRGLSHPRHRSRRRRQDHRQMEHLRRPRADAVRGDEVADPVAATAALCEQCRPAAVQHRASVVQRADQVSGHRYMGTRRAGGVPLEDLRRHLPRRQPGHPDSGLLALRRLRGGEDRQELEGQAVLEQRLQQDLLRCACIRVRRRSCWKRRAARRISWYRRGTSRAHGDVDEC